MVMFVLLSLSLLRPWSEHCAQALGGRTVPCQPQPSCDVCIRSQPNCAWCQQKNFTKPGEPDSTRCDSESALRLRGCWDSEIINPKNDHQVTERLDIDGHLQLTPQHVRLRLRPGSVVRFPVRFQRAASYPVDLYYLTDLSYSMKDDLENIKNLGQELLIALRNITESIQIGFGSFVDKTILPYVSMLPHKRRNPCPDRTEQCQPPFSFRNVLPLTANASRFEERVSRQNISGNLDPPEGGLDAVMQAAVCQREIGWRNVTRLLVYTSDAAFHTAGDGRLGGVFLPNDGRCHLDSNGLYSESERYDYPSVGHLAQTLNHHNIQPIFAVTRNILPTYKKLSELIPKSVVGELKADSSNILQLITAAYNNLSSTINLEHSVLPDGVRVMFVSHCRDEELGPSRRGECGNVHINEEIYFTVAVSISDRVCLRPHQQFHLKVLGFAETVDVHLEALCGCNCNDGGSESDHQHCSQGNGTYRCGQCSCHPGRLGKSCECARGDLALDDLTQLCRRDNASSVCGGRGSCVCGRCVCHGHLRGQYCQCDDASCVRHNNKLCSGNGQCSCGECDCFPGYTGEACECPDSESACGVPNGELCHGHGVCLCNRCVCHDGYQGGTCETCVSCPTPCDIHRECARCMAIWDGVEGACPSLCGSLTVEVVEKFPEGTPLCAARGDEGELVHYEVHYREGGTNLRVRRIVAVPDRTYLVISSVMSGIVLIGLLSLVVWRVTVELYDRREFQRFEKERRNARWNEAGNPLFQSATTTIVNPQFLQD